MKMKTPGAAVLLLLCSALVVVVADTQTQLPDTEALLTEMKEMRALMAKQGKELTQAKTQMETRLRASEKKAEEQRAELKHTQTQMQAMKVKLQASEKQVEQLKMKELKRERARVSFSTSLAITGITDLGPVSTAFPLVFKHVITNIGSAYNPHTGFFTAPVRGVYHFLVFAVGFGNAHRYTAVYLQKNGKQVVIASGHQTTGRVDTSNAASLLLEVGDVVSVNLYPQAWVHDSYNHHTTFSGHLLFTM